jgi:hypothetical protein
MRIGSEGMSVAPSLGSRSLQAYLGTELICVFDHFHSGMQLVAPAHDPVCEAEASRAGRELSVLAVTLWVLS